MTAPRRIIGLLIAGAIVAAGYVVVIHGGFLVFGGQSPAPLGALFPYAIVVLLLAAALLVWWLRSHPSIVRPLPRRITPHQAAIAAQSRSERQLYESDSQRVATCQHLQPIERAMRRDGVGVRLYHGPVVGARCRVDETELVRRFGISAPVVWMPHVPGDRFGDPGTAIIRCAEHASLIEVVPATEGGAGIPLWPAS